jgi:antagonist of KipI
VIKPGLLTTVQDLGRWGFQTFGVPVAGPMEVRSHRIANRGVGKADDAATLEMTLIAPELEFEADATIAIAGAEWTASVDAVEIEPGTATLVRSGSRLVFHERRRGARAYLAIAGGIDVPLVFGSRATHVVSRMGGLEGRALAAGDCLPVGASTKSCHGRWVPPPIALPDGGARLRAMTGPQDDLFESGDLETLFSSRYEITANSNRMGYRLQGSGIRSRRGADVISDATVIGSVQIPPSGQPILLMADRQTAGGYPKIATVASADLPLAGQLAPGDWIEFVPCDRGEAREALLAQERTFLAGEP